MGCQYGQIHNSLYKRRYNKKLNTLSKPLRKGRFCYAKNRTENRVKNGDGSKACAWLIYKSAAKLTARLTPRRHPLAALAGAEAKRTPQRANKPKTETKARRRRGIAAEPLGDCRAHLSPRTAFFQSVLYRYCFNRFRVRRAFVMSLSATALSPLCRSTVLYIRHLSSTRNRQRV